MPGDARDGPSLWSRANTVYLFIDLKGTVYFNGHVRRVNVPDLVIETIFNL